MSLTIFNGGGAAKVYEVPVAIDAATVIAPNKLVTIDGNGLIVEADATSTALGFTQVGSKDGETEILIVDPVMHNYLILEGTATQAFAQTDLGITCDVAISGTDQQIDLANSATNVLKVRVATKAGAVGSTENVQVLIANSI